MEMECPLGMLGRAFVLPLQGAYPPELGYLFWENFNRIKRSGICVEVFWGQWRLELDR